jgi:hypothetical protein
MSTGNIYGTKPANAGQKSSTTESTEHIEQMPKEATRRGNESEQQIASALARHQESGIAMMFNRKERKLVQDELVLELAQGFEHRRKAISMSLETRLHSIREACNHVLVTGKTHLRQQRIEYFGDVLRQVEQRMNALADDFLSDADQRFQRLDDYKSDDLKNRERLRLNKSVDDFLNTLDRLMDEFTSIINEHIDHQEPML